MQHGINYFKLDFQEINVDDKIGDNVFRKIISTNKTERDFLKRY